MANENEKPMGLVVRVKKFFDMTIQEAKTEYVKLSPTDKQDLVTAFNDAGMPTVLKS